MQSGADSFLVKPVEPQRLLAIVAKGCEARLLRRKSLQLGRLAAREGEGVAGDSRPMREALALAAAVAPRDTTVLLTGETGTGKGLVARHIHDLSPRRGEPFVELNCAGLQRDLTESELFGHERGAFTGASERKIGLFEAADGGSLFLDEIGEMDLGVQAKLLKVIEQRRFRRVGGTSEIETDVRVIAATHRDLGREVAAARFREDLYFRLHVFTIPLPPLRDRGEDIVPLALRYLRQFRPAAALDPAIGPEATALLKAYHWPGNVRELRNVIERAAILCPPGAAVGPEHLPPLATAPRPLPATAAGGEPLTLDEIEQRYLATALRAHKGNIQATARELGISRGTLYRKVKKYGIEVAEG
jgi:DNA-binding NtrC family response regulator